MRFYEVLYSQNSLATIASCRKLPAANPTTPTESSLKNCSPFLSLLLYHRKFRETRIPNPNQATTYCTNSSKPSCQAWLTKTLRKRGAWPIGAGVRWWLEIHGPKCWLAQGFSHESIDNLWKMVEILCSRCTSGSLEDRKFLHPPSSVPEGPIKIIHHHQWKVIVNPGSCWRLWCPHTMTKLW